MKENDILKKDYLYAYLYNNDGHHTPKLKIKNDIPTISSLIVKTSNCPKIVITDSNDNFILDTINGYIDMCPNIDYLESYLLPTLIPLQLGEKDIENINILDWGVDEYRNIDSIMKPYIYENFDVSF
ncbi:hypothetical protein [Senegalia massiliensis]|uniref:Uncharacterized protein n=1 Tax=Senegalia massiliensis TaxID=1720316 RepID=A0A845R4Z2_9CLOT|nr:hypothetical protein [Senegalia massiliensis]NBI07573.1 hypothetical protein [Senegalia massiliensis]